ncbi:hypothetical protein BKH30_09755 [Actinomyces oris]|uniref:Uncharacterized protein n=1 Tax=Actinomyces oris TaxID=544580 RepID=A0A1Q8VQ67_9ACTO|nr:hypothetical protein BKH30_09755 [Actinomyces oris]
MARVEYLIAATVGATAGVLPALAAGGGWGAAAAWPVLMSAGTCLVLTELIKAQILGRGVDPLRRRLILTGVAACLAGAALPFPRSLLGNTAVALLAGALAALAVMEWRRARRRLGQVHDAALLAVVARSFGAHVSLLSLDTRVLGRLLSPDTTRPVRPSPLWVAWIGSRLPRPLGVLIGVAQADWLLLRRQRRRLLQMGAGLAVAVLPLLSGAIGDPLRAVGYLIGGWIATLAVAEPARQAWFDGGPDASWPVASWVVRMGHLLVPAVLMSTRSLLSLVPAGSLNRLDSTHEHAVPAEPGPGHGGPRGCGRLEGAGNRGRPGPGERLGLGRGGAARDPGRRRHRRRRVGSLHEPPGLLTACLASESASYVGGFTPIGRGCSGRVSPCAGSISH